MTDSTKEQIIYENLLLSNFASINFIRQASAMLDLPVRTTGTALYYYHRFHQFMSINQNTKNPKNQKIVDENLPLYTNEELLVTTCLHLACKATEVPRKVRDLVNVGYRYFYPEDNILEVSEIYFKMRTTLTKSELLLVRALDFNLEVELPFTFCLTVLRNMGSIPFFYSLSDTSSSSSPYINGTTSISFQKIWKQMEQDMPINFNSIARVAWMFVWDSLCCPKLSLKYSIAEVGLGCLYLALRTSYADLQMTMTDWVDMWGASNNISVQTVRDVVMDLIELYEQSGLNNSNDNGNSALKE